MHLCILYPNKNYRPYYYGSKPFYPQIALFTRHMNKHMHLNIIHDNRYLPCGKMPSSRYYIATREYVLVALMRLPRAHPITSDAMWADWMLCECADKQGIVAPVRVNNWLAQCTTQNHLWLGSIELGWEPYSLPYRTTQHLFMNFY